MRKLSILALVVILASALSVVGFADAPQHGTKTGVVNATISTEQFLSLEIKNGDSISFNNVDPTTTHTKTQATKMKVKTNGDVDWEITVNVGSGETPSPAATYLSVTPSSDSSFSGPGTTGTTNNIYADYTLENTEDLPSGTYNVQVTFTVGLE